MRFSISTFLLSAREILGLRLLQNIFAQLIPLFLIRAEEVILLLHGTMII